MNPYGDRSAEGAFVEIRTHSARLCRRAGTGRGILAALGVLALALAGCAQPEKPPEQPELTEFVWPLPPEQPRIKFVRSLRFRTDVEDPDRNKEFLNTLLGDPPDAVESLNKPYGVYADKDGRIFVADTGWARLVVFDPVNRKFSFWGDAGPGQLRQPLGMSSDDLGQIYVADAKQKRVVIFDRDGKFVRAMGRQGELEKPTGIAVDQALGRVYVVDTGNHNIAVFDMDGQHLSTIGERGTQPGQFNFPTNIAVGGDGSLYVVDTMNFRVQVLDPDGNFLSSIGSAGRFGGQFSRPKGIALDSEGHVYVSDAAFSNFQIFDREGAFLLNVGTLGPEPGQFWGPAGVYIDERDRLYVADQFNRRVQVFQYLGDDGPAAGAGQAEAEKKGATE